MKRKCNITEQLLKDELAWLCTQIIEKEYILLYLLSFLKEL